MLHTTRRLDPLVPPPVKAEVERNTAFLEHGLIDDKHRLLEGNALVVRALTGVTAALSSLAASVDSLAGPSSPPLSPRKGRAYGGGFDPPLSPSRAPVAIGGLGLAGSLKPLKPRFEVEADRLACADIVVQRPPPTKPAKARRTPAAPAATPAAAPAAAAAAPAAAPAAAAAAEPAAEPAALPPSLLRLSEELFLPAALRHLRLAVGEALMDHSALVRVWLHDGSAKARSLFLYASDGELDEEVRAPAAVGVVGAAAASRRSILAAEARAHPAFDARVDAPLDPYLDNSSAAGFGGDGDGVPLLCVPMATTSGLLVGVVAVTYRAAHRGVGADALERRLAALEATVAAAAGPIRGASERSAQAAAAKAAAASTRAQLALATGGAAGAAEAEAEIARSFGCARCALWRVRDGELRRCADGGAALALDDSSIAGTVASRRQPLNVFGDATVARFVGAGEPRPAPVSSVLCVPVELGGRLEGVLHLSDRAGSEALLAGRAAGGAPVRRLVRGGGLFSDGDAEAAERVAKLLAIAMRATAYASE